MQHRFVRTARGKVCKDSHLRGRGRGGGGLVNSSGHSATALHPVICEIRPGKDATYLLVRAMIVQPTNFFFRRQFAALFVKLESKSINSLLKLRGDLLVPLIIFTAPMDSF